MLRHMSKLGDYIKDRRLERKWSLRDMADRTGLSFSLIGKIERGVVELPALDVLMKIAKGLQVDFPMLAGMALGVPPEQVGKGIGAEATKAAWERYEKLSPEKKKQVDRFLRLLEEED